MVRQNGGKTIKTIVIATAKTPRIFLLQNANHYIISEGFLKKRASEILGRLVF